MKIFYLVHNDPRLPGGTEKHVLCLAEAASERHQVTVFYPRVSKQPLTPRVESARHGAVRLLALHRTVRNSFLPPGPDAADLNRLLEQALAGQAPDVIHVHHLKNLPPATLDLCAAAPARRVMCLNDFEMFCMTTHLMRRNGLYCDASGNGRNCALYCLPRALRARERLVRAAGAAGRALSAAPAIGAVMQNRRNRFPSFATIIAASAFVKDRYALEGFPVRDMRILEFGIEQFEPVPPRPASRPVRFVSIGNINVEKGIDLLVKAFGRLSPDQAELTVYGAANEARGARLLQDAARRHPHIRHAGRYEDADLPAILGRADCLVNPTRRLETCSLVLSEAFMAGLPAVCSAAGALATRVTHGVNGLLFPIGDLNALVRCLEQVTADPALLDAMRPAVPAVMTAARYFQEMERIYLGESQ